MAKFILALALLLCLSIFCFAQQGIGNGTGNGKPPINESVPPKVKIDKKNKPLQILSKPRAVYTEEARKNQVSGVIRLRIEFKKDGKIGDIKVVKGLPEGLNEQAIEAAKNIKFEPQKVNGKAVTVTKILEYNFNLY